MAAEKAGVVYLQSRLKLLHTIWPRHILMIHEAGVSDDSSLPSPVKIDESHFHGAAIHNPACLHKGTSGILKAEVVRQRMQRHSEQAAEYII